MFYYINLVILFMCYLAINVDGFCGTIPTGSYGAVTELGVLQEELIPPGFYCIKPIFQKIKYVDTTFQIDRISSIKCKSADKQDIFFPYFEVKNKLGPKYVYDVLRTFEKPDIPYDEATILGPLRNKVLELCSQMTGEEMQGSKYASLNEVLQDYLQEYQKNRPELNGKDTGIEILKVFVEIPKLNKQVEDNYQMIATQKTAEEAERYRQLTLLKEKETRNKVEILEAEKVRDVAILKNQELIFKEEAEAKIAKIRAESAAEQKRMNADAESYAAHKKAQDNQLLLTKEYLQIKQLEYYGCQNTIHYGDGPKFLITPPLQGAVPIAVAAAAAA
jgi:hypothetical protein